MLVGQFSSVNNPAEPVQRSFQCSKAYKLKTKSVRGIRFYSRQIVLPVGAAYSAQPQWVHRCSVAEAGVGLPRRIGGRVLWWKTAYVTDRGDVKKAALCVHGSKNTEIYRAVFLFVLQK